MGAVLEAMFVKVSALPGGADCFSEEAGFCEASSYGMIQVLGLGAVYAMVLSHGSGLISDGAELLQVVPSLEHLVGSVVLPVLGAVPDGAIILFSGLTGARAQAQEQLSVGVGALAGSTILLLTLPWAMSILAGRVEMGQGRAIYRRPAGWKTAEHGKWTKLRTPLSLRALATTGVSCESAVAESARAMGLTALLYLLIQVPAMTRSWRAITAPTDDASALAVAAFERPYALGACVACTISFVLYLLYKARGATHDVVRTYKVEEARIALIKQGRLTLVGAMAHLVDRLDDARRARARDGGAGAGGAAAPSPADELRGPLVALEAQSAANGVVTTEAAESERADALAEIRDTLRPFFKRYDADGSHSIDGAELRVLFADLHEKLGVVEIAAFAGVGAAHGLPEALDDSNVEISFDAFVDIVIAYVRRRGAILCAHGAHHLDSYRQAEAGLIADAPPAPAADDDASDDDDDDDDDEMPDELRDLPPEEQHRRAKAAAGRMLALGTALVVAFSDPMVGVMSEMAHRTGVPAFYVAFVLAPVASNGAEVLSAYAFSKRKTERATTTSFSTLLGAAVMNNTFCLAIFMALIVARGDLFWEFTAETLAILAVELAMLYYGSKAQHTLVDGVCVGLLYPAGLALVVGLEALGLD